MLVRRSEKRFSSWRQSKRKLYHVLEHWRGTFLGLVYFWIAKQKKEAAKMGRKKIQITRIMDERNRQVRNKRSAWTGPSVILKINGKFEYIHPNSLFWSCALSSYIHRCPCQNMNKNPQWFYDRLRKKMLFINNNSYYLKFKISVPI